MKRRSTPAKEAVMAVLTNAGKAMSHDAIEKRVTIDVDRATIYRVLNRFCEDGLVHRIVAEDGKQYFAVCMQCEQKNAANHHFHFRCTRCQTIRCLQTPVHFSLPAGDVVESVNCVLTGLCQDCSS